MAKRKRDAGLDLFGTTLSGTLEEQRPFFENLKSFQTVDPDDKDDVDMTILDYLADKATKALLSCRSRELQGEDVDWSDADRQYRIASEWIYHLNTVSTKPNLPIVLRPQTSLLEMVFLITCRNRPEAAVTQTYSVESLNKANRDRVGQWERFHGQLLVGYNVKDTMLSSEELKANAKAARRFQQPRLPRSMHTDWIEFALSNEYVLLHSLFQKFLNVSSEFQRLFLQEMSVGWYKMVGRWMTAATLEVYQLRKRIGDRAMNDIFSYGFLNGGESGLEPIDRNNQALFSGTIEVGGPPKFQSEAWTRIRRKCIEELIPVPDLIGNGKTRLKTTEFDHQAFEFELIEYLSAMRESLPTPDLQQVENGNIEGLSASESDALLRRVGLKPQWPASQEDVLRSFEKYRQREDSENTSL